EIARVGTGQWGDVAARQLERDWLGRVWDVQPEGATLVAHSPNEQVVRIVPPSRNTTPFDLVLDSDEETAALRKLQPGERAWRVGPELWIADSLTIRLPAAPPWQTALNWSELPLGETALHRRLLWLGDALLARAPETSFAGLLPELLASGVVATRPDLPPRERLSRWRMAGALTALVPALARGDLAAAEQATNRLAGLGAGVPAAGDSFLLGLLAGLRLWPGFLEPTGLNQETVVLRLARTARERTGLVGAGLLWNGAEHRYGRPWHELLAELQDEEACSDERRHALEGVVSRWLAGPGDLGGSALAGLLLPFLWHQRHSESL
ncbi:MAG TPA: hypothetical protein VER55_08775, partial [Ardenticatenaceae bacterium]|nr:hypothetical protein [Ardenticatenaceae bacterium]